MTPPVFGHGHLRLYLLSLLAERSRHGYELIQALEERFGGTYVPSAGTIYPRLAKLEAEGLVEKRADGRKSVYAITDAGRAELEARRDELDGIEENVTDSVRRLADDVRDSVATAMRSLRADLAAAAREARDEGRRLVQDAARGAHDAAEAGGPADPGEPADAASAERAERAEPSRSHGEQLDARVALRHAEAALAAFRAEMRTELRGRAARGDLTMQTVHRLREALDATREALR